MAKYKTKGGPRQQVGPLRGPVGIQAQAQGTSLFHGSLDAIPEESNSALELAKSLSILQPSLFKLTDMAIEKDIKAGEAEGFTQARTKNREDTAAAVKAGAIPAGRSPWFRKGVRRSEARIDADEYNASLQGAFVKWKAKDSRSDEEADITGLMSSHLKEFMSLKGMDQDSSEFREVFMPMAQGYQTNMNNQFAAHRIAQVEQRAEDALGVEVGHFLKNYNDEIEGFLPDLAGGSIDSLAKEHIANGMDGTKANLLIAKAIEANAEETGDIGLWDVVDHINTGNGNKMGSIPQIKQLREASVNSIGARVLRDQARNDKAIEEQRKADKSVLTTTIIDQIQKKSLTTEQLDAHVALAGRLGGFEYANQVQNYYDASVDREQEVVDSPALNMWVEERIQHVREEGALAITDDDIMSMAGKRQITVSQAEKWKDKLKEAREGVDIYKDPAFKRIGDQLDKINGDSVFSLPGEEASKIVNSRNIYDTEVRAWANDPKNKNADFEMRTLYARSVMSRILESDQTVKDPLGEVDDPEAAKARNFTKKYPSNWLTEDPNSVDLTTAEVYPSLAHLNQAIQLAKTTKGQQGSLAPLAAHFNMTPAQFVEIQRKRLLNTQQPAAKK